MTLTRKITRYSKTNSPPLFLSCISIAIPEIKAGRSHSHPGLKIPTYSTNGNGRTWAPRWLTRQWMSLFQKVILTACIPFEQEAGWNTIKPASTIGRYWSLYNGALRLGVVCMCGWFLSKIGEALFGVIPSHASGTNHRTELQHENVSQPLTASELQGIILLTPICKWSYNNSPNRNWNTA